MLIDKILNTAFSFGAAVVIFGAWSKIEHNEYGSWALTAGLLTETAIFCIYGLLEWRKKPVSYEAPPPPPEPKVNPASKENVEDLTESIQQTVRVLNRIFRV
ncbi:MAG TPA: hypothetical protein VI233_13200 [Puia sp.]